MATTYERPGAQARTASGLNVLVGLWLVISPWVLAYSEIGSATWNCVLVGLAVAIFALIRVAGPLRAAGLSWLNFVLGIWLLLSPFLLNYGDLQNAMWNTVISGILVVILAAWSAVSTQNATPIRGPEDNPRTGRPEA